MFPLSNWTELDIWLYIHLEEIPVVPLYFAKPRPIVDRDGMLIMVDDDRLPLKDGEKPRMETVRFRSLGCYPLSGAVRSKIAADTADHVTFAALGDNGSGGRQAMAVAERMAETYRERPFGLVALLGDICYYGNFADRFDDVFRRPMRPLIDAGVGFELAIGNHDADLHHSDEGLEEIEAELRLLGTPGRYYTTHPRPGRLLLPRLQRARPLRAGRRRRSGSGSTTRWPRPRTSGRSCCCTIRCTRRAGTAPRPAPASGSSRSSTRHHVDLVLAGHDHHYERTHPHRRHHLRRQRRRLQDHRGRPQRLHRRRRVDPAVPPHRHRRRSSRRHAASAVDGSVADRFELRAREGR